MDFQRIVPRLGDQREAFEELCCQLARRTIPQTATFVRLHGAGGDGGIECYADLSDGDRHGWQAKYDFDIDPLLKQATDSLTTALRIHPELTKFTLCFPFDLTGPTGRRGKSGVEKFQEWREKQIQSAANQGRELEIEDWPAAKLRQLLVEIDVSGGIRKYFFDEQHFSPEWFAAHLDTAKATAGPRYTPELNVQTEVGEWFSAFGCTAEWVHEFEGRLEEATKEYKRLNEAIVRTSGDSSRPKWPDGIREQATTVSENITKALETCERIKTSHDKEGYEHAVKLLEDALTDLSSMESQLLADLEGEHGPGHVDSPGFRQFMAEYQVSFPAANLDITREAAAAIRELCDWLTSPKGELAFHWVFVLSGEWGVGKTHGVCDAASRRLDQKHLSCVVFGHQFSGEPDPWTRFIESLGLSVDTGKDGLLDALDAAAEASAQPLVLFIDAINETFPRQYWRNRLAAFIQEISNRPNLRVCITCRSPYLSQCLPDGHEYPIVDHPGFKGIEQVSCTAFFQHYGLKPPVAPILQPELANPLYLRLVCETLKARGIDQLPTGWSSTGQVIAAFLEEKEKEFSKEKSISTGARTVTKSLQMIARAIAESGRSELRWSEAEKAIVEIRPDAGMLRVLEWLIGSSLLIEETAQAQNGIPAGNTVRPAFERLGDFLIASELMARLDEKSLESAFEPEGPLRPFAQDPQAVEKNHGVLSALSILIPEQYQGRELPDLMMSPEIRTRLVEITVASFPGRDPNTFTGTSRELMREALNTQDVSYLATESLLAIAWRTSAMDAIWLHGLLEDLPLAQRDAYWCGYLHESYEQSGTVRRLINAAFELPLDTLDSDVAERWAILLTWFTAAADRRVKDWATRALIKILAAKPVVISHLLERFLSIDDDEVRERLLLASYGALILSPDNNVIGEITTTLHAAFRERPLGFDNAIIRDHIRCITELAEVLNVLPESCDPQATMQPISSQWPLEFPSKKQVEKWEGSLGFRLDWRVNDFFIYTMGCLLPWMDAVSRTDMGKWISQRIARDFGYEGSGCEEYDRHMRGNYGGGRAKPKWAERIGKKYQWIALYQLASRLHDHVERKEDGWALEPLRTPLILMEERKLDPTLPPRMIGGVRNIDVWWVEGSVDLQASEQLSDSDWVSRKDDLPSLEKLLSAKERDNQRWLLLASYPTWSNRREDAGYDEQYRYVWTYIESHLVAKENAGVLYGFLHRRNFFGQWMRQGASWLYGFAGEYPWASSFNIETDEYHSHGGFGHKVSVPYMPAWNELAMEWEYDASLEDFHMLAPARVFFSLSDLWWNGRDGYRLRNGGDVFRDISVSEAGPRALIADIDDLLVRLDRLGLRLIWTVLGEKIILGGRDDKPAPRRTFSQIARLEEGGSVRIGDRVFFDNYDKDTGPLQSVVKIGKS